MTKFLASVRNLEESLVALNSGADVIDLKAPDRGSLGALPFDEIARIVAALRRLKPTSATVGDLPMEPALVEAAVAATARTGVDYVKVGFFPGGDAAATVRRLKGACNSGLRLVAVLFADRHAPRISAADLSHAGFVGCMLDTLDKKLPLTEMMALGDIQQFIASVRDTGMICGLAGSLAESDVSVLLPLRPDYLGFRGALCHHHRRTDQLDPNRVRRIAALVHTDAALANSATQRALSAHPKAILEIREIN